MKGQVMLITAILISLVMLTTGSAVSSMGEKTYEYTQEGYVGEIIEEESAQVDKTFRKNRENYRKMIGFLESYETSTSYNDAEQCYNVSLQNSKSTIRLECTG